MIKIVVDGKNAAPLEGVRLSVNSLLTDREHDGPNLYLSAEDGSSVYAGPAARVTAIHFGVHAVPALEAPVAKINLVPPASPVVPNTPASP